MRILLSIALLALFSATPASEPDPGETLYKSRCGLCHQLPDPEMLTSRQWRIVLETMQKRMGHIEMPPLSAEEREQILAYLSRRARKK